MLHPLSPHPEVLALPLVSFPPPSVSSLDKHSTRVWAPASTFCSRSCVWSMRRRGKYRFVSVGRPLTRASAGAAAFNRGRALPTPRAAGKAAPRTCASRRPTTRPWHRRASGLTAPGSTSPANTDEARGRHPEVVGTSGDGSCRRIHQRLHHRRRRRRRHHRRRHHRLHRHRRINQWVTAHGRGVGRGGAAGSDVYLVAAFAAAARFRCGASCNGVWRCCVDYTSRRVVPVELVTVGTVVTPLRGERSISRHRAPPEHGGVSHECWG